MRCCRPNELVLRSSLRHANRQWEMCFESYCVYIDVEKLSISPPRPWVTMTITGKSSESASVRVAVTDVISVPLGTQCHCARVDYIPLTTTWKLYRLGYLVDSHGSTSAPVSSKPRESVEVLSSFCVPEYTKQGLQFYLSMTLPVRLRTSLLQSSSQRPLQVTEVAVDILQREKCR